MVPNQTRYSNIQVAQPSGVGDFTGVSPGSFTATASATLQGGRGDCPEDCSPTYFQNGATGTITRAIPVNFTIQSESNLNNGSLFFTYVWSSSSGKQPDLSHCTVGETVYYPSYPTTPYTWPLPMVANPPTPNPASLSGSGGNAGSTDTNYPPDSYQQPYSAASFQATQRFWFSCPGYMNDSVQSLAPDVTIIRRTFYDTDGFWKYQISKSGYVNTIRLPNQ
jgi:hypothetical protein